MSKFKVGDIVRGRRGSPYSITNQNMIRGEVISISGDCMTVRVVSHTNRSNINGQWEVEMCYFSPVDAKPFDRTKADKCIAAKAWGKLQKMDLGGADLTGADLTGADLTGAYLKGADLKGAYLKGAYLKGADLAGADLKGAYLKNADLTGADLTGADLTGADLKGAKADDKYLDIICPLACPEHGAFTGFKKAYNDAGGVIVELLIPADAKRSSATGRKCRCDKAIVVDITDASGNAVDTNAVSQHDCGFIYQKGVAVSVFNFDDNRWKECAPGIHFFITRQEAVDYGK